MNKEAEREALQIALDALDEIALAGMSGSGQESEEGMRAWHARRAWEFIGIAARAKEAARRASPPASIPDPWQSAVIDEAASLFVSEEGTPREVVKRVIAANVQIALDPAVSSEAQALIDKGAAAAAPPALREAQGMKLVPCAKCGTPDLCAALGCADLAAVPAPAPQLRMLTPEEIDDVMDLNPTGAAYFESVQRKFASVNGLHISPEGKAK